MKQGGLENFLDQGYHKPDSRQNNMDCSDIQGTQAKRRFTDAGAQVVDNVNMVVAGKKVVKTNISDLWSMGQEFEKIVSKEERNAMQLDDINNNGQYKKNQFGAKMHALPENSEAAGVLKVKPNKFETDIDQQFILNHQNQSFNLFDKEKPLVEKSIAGDDRSSQAPSKASKMKSVTSSQAISKSRLESIRNDEDNFLKENIDTRSRHSRHNSQSGFVKRSRIEDPNVLKQLYFQGGENVNTLNNTRFNAVRNYSSVERVFGLEKEQEVDITTKIIQYGCNQAGFKGKKMGYGNQSSMNKIIIGENDPAAEEPQKRTKKAKPAHGGVPKPRMSLVAKK